VPLRLREMLYPILPIFLAETLKAIGSVFG
jgi:hypothetical protein